ncbi:16S rRNA (cytosine(967)-C(5))-methyltransferase RsmB [Conexibacter sp. JD483]|uniref:16S rRNA (cytosine(967)-C(5))-methyltransferase RsmB n=1 Tax=unclassified Conexibacter TaxID=2627773 RepID=UPI00271A68A8|nr:MULTISPECIES: 16S rRNA (cytosine(967)-C(5))-methyltransferase RsmB [unclassified Conexibacter]MDO8197873.1 16S rRNA (cytosine(967)-C(5))-methyltransferase RsmB [Conexibacter sp. CPCC 205762]MDR9370081.1 16S rRNA (cytosine(967)-C(5))-methyltransferase RsmB [Conexibacter sp. JD483]
MPLVENGVSPARRVAAAVLRRVQEEGAYADRALAGEAARAGLDHRDHGFATALAYGAVQRRRTLDHLIERLTRRPVEQLDPAVRDALRLGLLQLLFLDGVAPHAAVDQSVELAKAGGGHGYKLVNAVLRRAQREGPRMLAQLGDGRPRTAALRYSVPDWLARLWWQAIGPDDARALLARVNEPAESALRVNTLRAAREVVADAARADAPAPREARDAVAAALRADGVETHAAALDGLDLPEGLVADDAFDLRGDARFAAGELVAQSRAAQAAARLLAPAPGMRVLDLCAAPGGKASHLAQLVGPDGAVVAVERNPRRAAALRETLKRLGAQSIVEVEAGDAARPRDDEPFDAVLIDPPCSGLGTLQGRPDLRWRASEQAIDELAELQFRILTAGAAALRPGGALLYVTCTISPRENERVVQRFLADPAGAGFALADLGSARPSLRSRIEPRTLQLLPHRDSTDGFFIARLEKAS